jgi:hypothetical protein
MRGTPSYALEERLVGLNSWLHTISKRLGREQLHSSRPRVHTVPLACYLQPIKEFAVHFDRGTRPPSLMSTRPTPAPPPRREIRCFIKTRDMGFTKLIRNK